MPGVTFGNPIIVASGTTSTLISRQAICIQSVYWVQPPTAGSGVVLRKHNLTGPEVLRMLAEVSGQSQLVNYGETGRWVNDLYCENTGAPLYIFTR